MATEVVQGGRAKAVKWFRCQLHTLPAAVVVNLGAVASTSGDAPTWGAQATSRMLERKGLATMAEVLPEWKVTQMV